MTWTTARFTKVRGFMITIAQKVFATSGALLLLLATGIAGCEPKTKFIRCTQADCVDQTNSLLWSDDAEQRALRTCLTADHRTPKPNAAGFIRKSNLRGTTYTIAH